MRRTIWLTPFLFLLVAKLACAQSCNPAAVHYIVRDEKGAVISKTELNAIYEQIPKQIDDGDTSLSEVSFAPDNQTFYWSESVDWEKGTKVPVLLFANASTCTLHFTEVTLQYHEKKMRLLFNIDITRSQDDRRPVIESLPFQNGTFKLDLTGWSHERDKVVPAMRWKRQQF